MATGKEGGETQFGRNVCFTAIDVENWAAEKGTVRGTAVALGYKSGFGLSRFISRESELAQAFDRGRARFLAKSLRHEPAVSIQFSASNNYESDVIRLCKSPLTITERHIAWLSGFIDGEGSVGLTLSNGTTLVPTLQIAHTCQQSTKHIQSILYPILGRIPAWTYNEKHPERHRDSIYIRITGMARIRRVAAAVGPFSVTKRKHWQLLTEFIDIRTRLRGIDRDGNVKRGGSANDRSYGAREWEIYNEMRILNRRGPRS